MAVDNPGYLEPTIDNVKTHQKNIRGSYQKVNQPQAEIHVREKMTVNSLESEEDNNQYIAMLDRGKKTITNSSNPGTQRMGKKTLVHSDLAQY